MAEKLSIKLRGGASLVGSKPVFSIDSKWLLVASGDVVKVISVVSGETVRELQGHNAPVTGVVLNPNNSFQAFSCSRDGRINKWEFLSGTLLKTFCVEGGQLTAIYAAAAGDQGTPGALYVTQMDRDAASSAARLLRVMFFCSETVRQKFPVVSTAISHVRPQPRATAVSDKGDIVAAVHGKHLTIVHYPGAGRKPKTIRLAADKECELTSVAVHPSDQCVATGTSNGRILCWYNFLSEGSKVTKQVRHWHSLGVRDLTYSRDGSVLLSGGGECVLVVWSAADRLDTLPRLGAPITYLAASRDGTRYATAHTDNSIRVISREFVVLQHIEGLTRAGGGVSSPGGVGLLCDPHSPNTLVTNGRPGHLQFYDLEKDRQKYNLDIVGENYVSADPSLPPLTHTDVTHAALSADWLATVQRRDDGQTAPEMALKFWQYDAKTQSYTLNTVVDLPHAGPVHTLAFCPDSDLPIAVTTSSDGTFKIWSLEDDSNIYRCGLRWGCESAGSYRGLGAGAAAFSEDGSVLAVAFGETVTLWDPQTNALRTTLHPGAKVSHVHFGGHLLLAAAGEELVTFDLLRCCESWRWRAPGGVTALAAAGIPGTDVVAVFTAADRQLRVYAGLASPEAALYRHPEPLRSPVTAAAFIPHNASVPAAAAAALHFINKQQELQSLGCHGDDSAERALPPPPRTMPQQELVPPQQNLPAAAFCLWRRGRHGDRPGHHDDRHSSRRDAAGNLLLKQLWLETACHVTAPLDASLCPHFVSSLLLAPAGPRSRSKPIDDVDSDDDSGTEMENSHTSSAAASDSEDEVEKSFAAAAMEQVEETAENDDDVEKGHRRRELEFQSIADSKRTFSWLLYEAANHKSKTAAAE